MVVLVARRAVLRSGMRIGLVLCPGNKSQSDVGRVSRRLGMTGGAGECTVLPDQLIACFRMVEGSLKGCRIDAVPPSRVVAGRTIASHITLVNVLMTGIA